jgi:predicted lipoprotein with Yx(FWY)xxD motif
MASITQGQRHRRAGGAWSALLATTTVAALVGGAFFTSAASAQAPKKHKAAAIVKEVNRKPYGKILTTAKKLTLYVQQTGTCTTTGCLEIWPPLLMPSGQTVPTGAPGLGTVTMSEGLQVTYNSMPLYTFYTDSKKSANGESQGGFVVAQVATGGYVVASKSPKPTVVVAETTRAPFGEILTNKKSKTLYVLTAGNTCTGGCLKVWPPLLMPKGKTMPAGATGLGTTAFGAKRLQVTYNSNALYTFKGDSGKSANGNGEAGFVVAQVSS